MNVAEAQTRLKEILSKKGFSLDNPDPRIAWAGFKAFVLEPVDCAHVAFCLSAASTLGRDRNCFTLDLFGSSLLMWTAITTTWKSCIAS